MMNKAWIAALAFLLSPLSAMAQRMPAPLDAACVVVDGWQKPKPKKFPNPLQGNQVVAGPQGEVSVYLSQEWVECKVGKTKEVFLGWGVRDAQGKIVIPYSFTEILVTSPQGGLVYAPDRGWGSYTAGKGYQPFDFQVFMIRATDDYGSCNEGRVPGGRGPNVVTVLPQPKLGDRLQALVYYGSETPVTIRDVKDQPRRVGRLLYVNAQAPNGDPLAGVYNLFGLPVSGTLQSISFWYEAKHPQTQFTCQMGLPEMLAEGPSLDKTSVREFGSLYFPLNRDGSFFPMPAGAIGTFPLSNNAQALPTSRLADGQTDHVADFWGVVYPDAQGWSFSLHRGSPLRAVASATGNEPRYRTPVRESGIIAAQDVRDGSWKVFQPGALQPMALAQNFADGRAAIASVKAMAAAEKAAIAESERVRREEERVLRREQALAMRQEARRKGLGCQAPLDVELGVAEARTYVQDCWRLATNEEFNAAQALGVDPAFVADYRERQRSERLAVAEQRRQYEAYRAANPGPPPYYPGQFSSAIQAAGNQVVADIQRGADNWFEQRQSDWREQWQRNQRGY